MRRRNAVEIRSRSSNKFFRGSQIQTSYDSEDNGVYSDFRVDSRLVNPAGSNRCWLNATLQVLLGMSRLLQDLRHAEQDGSRTPSPVLQELLRLARARDRGEGAEVRAALAAFHDSLVALDPAFTSGRQLDAAEFLTRLLEYLGAGPVSSNLEFVLETRASCPRCSRSCLSEEVHRMLLLGVADASQEVHLQALVESYFTAEARRCEDCSAECRGRTAFRALPRFLIIQLKRYVMQDGVAQKICQAVRIPSNLFMQKSYSNASYQSAHQQSSPKTSSSEAFPDTAAQSNMDSHYIPRTRTPGDEYSYRLMGTVIHHGSSLHSGHYVADVYSWQQGAWYHYNDSSVSPITEQEVLGWDRQRNSYILVYLSSLDARNCARE
ncbi:uncharacterized protein LOC134537871 isoform X2 [Bacillus rossius redtenbacheri]|uniref:uncharacterized protein LOC134537871 isoform X2 n=1 Tax=Bacillus rossius redtenbacheri TaxID=93214 RepID=UPI002FDEE31F